MKLTVRELRQLLREAVVNNVDAFAKQVIESGDKDSLQVLVDMLQEAGDPRGEELLEPNMSDRFRALLSFVRPSAEVMLDGSDNGFVVKNIYDDMMFVWRRNGYKGLTFTRGHNRQFGFGPFNGRVVDHEYPIQLSGSRVFDDQFTNLPVHEIYVNFDGDFKFSIHEAEAVGNIYRLDDFDDESMIVILLDSIASNVFDIRTLWETTFGLVNKLIKIAEDIPTLFPKTN